MSRCDCGGVVPVWNGKNLGWETKTNVYCLHTFTHMYPNTVIHTAMYHYLEPLQSPSPPTLSRTSTYHHRYHIPAPSQLQNKDLILAIACNKADLPKRVVSRARSETFANSIDAILIDTSAKDNFGVTELFQRVSCFCAVHMAGRML